MLSFYADIILLAIPLINSLITLTLFITLWLEVSAWKKHVLRLIMLIACGSIPFYLFLQFTHTLEDPSQYAAYLFSEMQRISMYGLSIISLLGLCALMRIHVYNGKDNVPKRASGRIHTFTFKSFFRSYWRWIIYVLGMALFFHTYQTMKFYADNYSDLHIEEVHINQFEKDVDLY